MSLSASKVECAAKCAASLVLPQTDEKRASTTDGIERHAALEARVNSGDIPPELTARWPGYIWRSEVAYAIDLATDEGRELGVGLGRGYGAMGPFEIPGTMDLEGTGPNSELVIVDRKGYDPNVSQSAVNGQLHTLALMACRKRKIQTCEVAIWHETRPLDVSTVEPWDLTQYADELRMLLEDSTKARAEYRRTGIVAATPGDHCRWCGAFWNCPAQNAQLTKVSAGTIGASIEAISLEDDDEAARFYELSKSLGMLLRRMRERLHVRGEQRPIPLGNGTVFGKRPTKGQRQIDADKAYEAIRTKYGQKIADEAVTREATQTGIVAAFEKAGIASPKAEKDRLMKALDALGAVKRNDGFTVDEHEAAKPALKAMGE